MSPRQLHFDFLTSLSFNAELATAVEEMAEAGIEERGAIFTKRSVVEFILDLAGYHPNIPLYEKRLLEPSFGNGDFLLAAAERLLKSWKGSNHGKLCNIEVLTDCICAVELHVSTFEKTKIHLLEVLRANGIGEQAANRLVESWLLQNDFLLADLPCKFDFVVGNPPYVRQERISNVLIAAYRKRYSTFYDRADLYVPFIERSLNLLNEGGNLGFICSDRWMKNRYGGPLREMVSRNYHLKIYVDMVDTAAFHSEVSAYPAITIISKGSVSATRIAHRPTINEEVFRELAKELTASKLSGDSAIREIKEVVNGKEPWILDSSDQLALIRRLEQSFPNLEEAGCKVGIGVATGADKAFIGPYEMLDVEPGRKLPLVTTKDIVDGKLEWKGLGVINPFEDDGSLVDLRAYPRLEAFLENRREQIANRHVAKKSPRNWYRTIDRIDATLTEMPKLLIPDIKGHAQITYDPGNFYPHHNLYYITSDEWDLQALQAVLRSGIARLFISVYSTRMRGGYLRFQAQYLRRIRIPLWTNVPRKTQRILVEAAQENDPEACNEAVFQLYQFTEAERQALGGKEV